ncbi:MAG TPA: hypothetical protein VGL51_05810 [Solirubrobacteraceae bacterium]|jgi:hypothetical protein
MDETRTRSQIHDHADAVVRGDMDAVIADFSAELRPQVPQLAQALPMPVTSAEVKKIELGDEESVAEIQYTGDSGQVTIRTRWREIDGRPSIVAGEPL